MTNPALELAELLEKWRALAPGEDVNSRRGAQAGAGFWRQQAHAVELLGQVDDAIQEMRSRGRRTDHYAEPLVHWYVGVFAPYDVWHQAKSSTSEIVPKHAVDALFGLADTLDGVSAAHTAPALGAADAQDIFGGIEDIEALLNDGALRLPGAAEDYVRALLKQARELLDATAAGSTIDLMHKLNELVGMLYSVIESESQDAAVTDRLREAVRKVQPWTATLVRFGTKAIEVSANVKELLT